MRLFSVLMLMMFVMFVIMRQMHIELHSLDSCFPGAFGMEMVTMNP